MNNYLFTKLALLFVLAVSGGVAKGEVLSTLPTMFSQLPIASHGVFSTLMLEFDGAAQITENDLLDLKANPDIQKFLKGKIGKSEKDQDAYAESNQRQHQSRTISTADNCLTHETATLMTGGHSRCQNFP